MLLTNRSPRTGVGRVRSSCSAGLDALIGRVELADDADAGLDAGVVWSGGRVMAEPEGWLDTWGCGTSAEASPSR
ncbi:hypothetical protein ACQB6R_02910 [Propionibacteriaceae bacterium G1746]|uniref:hypothetical protein n=1 Tax=Aestuariimicrobium sp. G57 TaxID=3418485 RepID=UPI003C2789E1